MMLVLIFIFNWVFLAKLFSWIFKNLIFLFQELFWVIFWKNTLLVVKWPLWPPSDLLRSLNIQKRNAPKFHSKFSQEFKNQVFKFLDQKNSQIFLVWRPKNQFLSSMFSKVILACFNNSKILQYINATESLNK